MKMLFYKILRYAGLVFFALGLMLNMAMVFFGLWPSLLYLIFMVCGAIVFFGNKSGSRDVVVRLFDNMAIRKFLSRTATFLLTAIVLVTGIFFLSRDYINRLNTISDSREISSALKSYKGDRAGYPDHLDSIISNDPLRKGWSKDRWGTQYLYSIDRNRSTFKLTSAGKDKKFGTDDDLIFE
jgi:hypothetical protein